MQINLEIKEFEEFLLLYLQWRLHNSVGENEISELFEKFIEQKSSELYSVLGNIKIKSDSGLRTKLNIFLTSLEKTKGTIRIQV